jgi:outer membrane protein assembly factor BamB
MSRLPLLLALIIGLAAPLGRAGDAWPEFRGATMQGVVETGKLPLHWGEEQNVVWKTAIHGKAWSSPVVWGKQVWMTTATPDGHELYAVCADRESGKIVFDLKLFDVPNPQYCIPFNSYASPSPCIEEGRVYVTFGSPGTACIDTKTGQVLWSRRDFVCNHYRGAGSSPLLYRNLLIMHFDGSDYQYVVALNKDTGETLWRTDRDVDYGDLEPNGKPKADGDFRKAFATPRIATFDGKDMLISLGSKALYAYEPGTGKELWRVDVKSSFSGSDTPVVGEGMIFFGSGHGQSELLAVTPKGEVAWRSHKKVPTRSSLIYADGLLYMTSDAGIVSCLEARTGDEVWHGRIDGEYSASPLYGGGRIYFFNQTGKTTVLAAGREFKLLAENHLGAPASGQPRKSRSVMEMEPDEGFMASPAAAGDALFLRTKTCLYRIESRD